MEKKNRPFLYGIGMFGTSLAINMFRGRASAFYVLLRGLTLENLALITFIYTFLDIIDNPIYGILSDNTRTRFGRRKLWLLIGTPLFALFFILFYSPPEGLIGGGLFVWALIFYFITGTLDSLINANYGALFPELFPDDKIRAKTNAIRQTAQLFAMVIGIALTPMIADKIGYVWTAIIYGVVSMAVILLMAFNVHEPKQIDLPKAKFIPAILSIVKSRNFWIVGFANAFYSAAMGLVMSSIAFYVKYALGMGSTQETILLGAVIAVAILGVTVWSMFVKKFGSIKVWRIALIVLTVAFIPLFFANSLITAIIAAVCVGLGFSGVISTMDLLGAKVLDEDFAKHGIKREGIFSSTMGFMNRLSGLFVSLGLLLSSRIYGFESGDVPGTRPDDAARFLLCLFPLALSAIGVVFTFFVKFDEEKIKRPPIESSQENTTTIEKTDELLNEDAFSKTE
ncbi:MAG: Inner membrane symporter YihP [Firmicutes bacterium ADurb.Bin080]|nr:MFS transporter [Clostridiales bacterium]OQC11870.1 MAG: Inner membrane symporter YihP [Firmicutes bacterium ADurb.Bin080]